MNTFLNEFNVKNMLFMLTTCLKYFADCTVLIKYDLEHILNTQ